MFYLNRNFNNLQGCVCALSRADGFEYDDLQLDKSDFNVVNECNFSKNIKSNYKRLFKCFI